MKKIVMIFLVILCIYSCDTLKKVVEGVGSNVSQTLTQQDVAEGLKDALNTGIANAVSVVSKTNGFYNNSDIAIPFPSELKKVKDLAVKAGLSKQVTQFEEKLNRAAEDAAKGATEVFVTAIKQMTITDAISILKGSDDAATQYLKKTTTTVLYDKFYPVVEKSTQKVMLAKYWTPLGEAYNGVSSLTGGAKVDADLNSYITNKALDGLFLMVAKEEKNIRTDPGARVTEILKKVFGSSLNPYNK